MILTNDILFFTEASSCFEILKVGFFLGNIIAQLRIFIFFIVKLYKGHLKLIQTTLWHISKISDPITMPYNYLSNDFQRIIEKMEMSLLPFNKFVQMLYSGTKDTYNYYSWKYKFKQESSFKDISYPAFAMFPIFGLNKSGYKNLVIHAKKKVLDGPGAGSDVIDKYYFESLKRAQELNSVEPILDRISTKPEALKEKIAFSRVLKESEKEIDPVTYKQTVLKLNNILQISFDNKITVGASIKEKYSAKFDTPMAKNFHTFSLEKQVQNLEELYPKTAEVMSENIAAIAETTKTLAKSTDKTVTSVISRAAQHLENERKQDTISIFTSNQNKQFIDHLASFDRPLSVTEIKVIASSYNVKQSLLVQDVSIISVIKANNSCITSQNFITAFDQQKLEPLNNLFNSNIDFKTFFRNAYSDDATYKINWVLNMSCSEKYLTDLEWQINNSFKSIYPAFFMGNKPLIQISINKVPEDHVTYIGIDAALAYFDQSTIT